MYFYDNSNKKIKRRDLLNEVNSILKKHGHKEISLTSLKRYIQVSKTLSNKERKELYDNVINNCIERQTQLKNAIIINNKKLINACKKKCEYIDTNIIKYINE